MKLLVFFRKIVHISENNIKVPDECLIEIYFKIYLGFLWDIPLSINSI